MRAIILAAGLGTRLRPLTDEVPKCMVKVGNKRILDSQIEALKNNGISKIYIIGGYKVDVLEKYLKEKYDDKNIILINNDIYDATNNMYSLNLAREVLYSNSFILLNGDVFIEDKIIEDLVNSPIKDGILCDNSQFNDESMKVIVKENRITSISKQIEERDAFAISMDIYLFSESGSMALFDKINEFVENGEVNKWTEVALNDILSKVEFNPLVSKGKWMEIDDLSDLDVAKEIFE